MYIYYDFLFILISTSWHCTLVLLFFNTVYSHTPRNFRFLSTPFHDPRIFVPFQWCRGSLDEEQYVKFRNRFLLIGMIYNSCRESLLYIHSSILYYNQTLLLYFYFYFLLSKRNASILLFIDASTIGTFKYPREFRILSL